MEVDLGNGATVGLLRKWILLEREWHAFCSIPSLNIQYAFLAGPLIE
jgi:hypothetical protein